MSGLRFFHKDECPFCWKARIALAETGTDYELITLGPGDDRGELDRLSPSGTTPVLADDRLVIWESAVILEYLNDQSGGLLMPTSDHGRAQARLLQAYSDSQIGRHLREVVFEKRGKPEIQWDRERIAKGEAGWRRCLDWLEAHLRRQDFFSGSFGVAECALYPRFALAERYSVGVDGRHPGLLRWYTALSERPSCRATRPASWSDSQAA